PPLLFVGDGQRRLAKAGWREALLLHPAESLPPAVFGESLLRLVPIRQDFLNDPVIVELLLLDQEVVPDGVERGDDLGPLSIQRSEQVQKQGQLFCLVAEVTVEVFLVATGPVHALVAVAVGDLIGSEPALLLKLAVDGPDEPVVVGASRGPLVVLLEVVQSQM